MADVDMSATSSDDDSDYQGVEVSETDMNLIIQLEAKLEENPSNYDALVQFIDVLRRCKMTERLREVRRAMHESFPLSESLWLDWITDKLESITGEEDIPKINSLLETAQEDYLSIALWIQRLEFVNNFDPVVQSGTPEGLQRIRDLAEEALNFHGAGLHCTEGSKLWDWYLNFELAQESKEGITPQEREAASEKVRNLYRRRLAVPLQDGEETLAAYTAWEKERKHTAAAAAAAITATEDGEQQKQEEEESLVPKNVKRSFDFAQRAYNLRQPFEQALVTAAVDNPSELLTAFMSYIKLEESGTTEDSTTSSRVELMYERAVAAFPVTSFLWLQYGRYLEVVLQSTSAAASVYARGVRNCPWVGELYERILRLTERTPEATDDQHEAVYNKAVDAGVLQSAEDYLVVALARLDALRKQKATSAKDKKALLERIQAVYSTISTTIQTKFPIFYDPAFQLAEYSASLEMKLSSSGKGKTEAVESGKAIWEDALKAGQGAAAKCAAGWLKYIEFLKNLTGGDVVEAVREVFKRCYAREMEGYGQLEVCNAWLKFEREEGSADDYFQAWSLAEPLIAQASAAATAAAAMYSAEGGAGAGEATAAAPPVLSKEQTKALRQQNDPTFHKKKRKMDDDQKAGRGRRDGSGGSGGGVKRSRTEAAPEKTQPNAPAPAPTTTATTMDAAKDGTTTTNVANGAPLKDFAARRALSAFVKHLPEDATEDSIRELFSPCGTINHIKIGMDHATGRHKGFAYVEFETAEHVEAACKLNGTSIGEKTLFVAPSNPPADVPGGGRGGRGGGRGGGGRGGRGRGGIGYSGSGGGGGGGTFGGGGQVAKATQRGHLDISGGGGDGGNASADLKPVVGFVPRAAAIQKPYAKSAGGGGGEEPKSNSDFRKMLLEKKS